MIELLRMMCPVALSLALGWAGGACRKNAVPSDPAFEGRWSALTQAGIEALYVQDDRGESLMGSVRRASRVKTERPPLAEPSPSAGTILPEQPPLDEVQRIIRGNLVGVRGCYLSMVRTGQAKSGKAIVSFSIGADGKALDLSVDAPSFVDTSLPRCVTAQIAHWEFPKSQRGGAQVSYPFVFVGS